jgi:antitoxin component YwqK of YwqJK toxin-antitoxin module
MNKNILMLFVLCFGLVSFAQQEKQLTFNEDTSLTEVTYFHDNGEVSQTGVFNAEGKVHGKWKSYDANGNKVAIGNYDNGKKVGKWFFWLGDTLKEVDYIDSRIVNINHWDNKTKVTINN